MDDPLVLLREYVIGERLSEVRLSGSDISFSDGQTFPKETRTSYKSSRGTSDFYTLDTLLFLCKTFASDQHMRPGAYVKEARDAGQAAVNLIDRTVRLPIL